MLPISSIISAIVGLISFALAIYLFAKGTDSSKSQQEQQKEKMNNVIIGTSLAGVAALATSQVMSNEEIRRLSKLLANEAAAVVKNRGL